MSAEEIIREYHEATIVFKLRASEELAKLEHLRDADIRQAKAELAIPEEIRVRQMQAGIAYDQLKNDREERWIKAHEDMYGVKRLLGEKA